MQSRIYRARLLQAAVDEFYTHGNSGTRTGVDLFLVQLVNLSTNYSSHNDHRK